MQLFVSVSSPPSKHLSVPALLFSFLWSNLLFMMHLVLPKCVLSRRSVCHFPPSRTLSVFFPSLTSPCPTSLSLPLSSLLHHPPILFSSFSYFTLRLHFFLSFFLYVPVSSSPVYHLFYPLHFCIYVYRPFLSLPVPQHPPTEPRLKPLLVDRCVTSAFPWTSSVCLYPTATTTATRSHGLLRVAAVVVWYVLVSSRTPFSLSCS